MDETRTLIVRMTESQLMFIRDSLHQSRLSCEESDCYMCGEMGELERRIVSVIETLYS